MKKIIALLMAVAMVFSVTACGSDSKTESGTSKTAEDKNTKSDSDKKTSGELTVDDVMNAPVSAESDFSFCMDDEGNGGISLYRGSSEIVVVPEKTDRGDTVKYVNKYTFSNRTTDKAIRFADTIETFDECACALNEGVEIVVFGKNTKTIGNSAFLRCKSLREVVFNEGLETISDLAFAECENLKSVYIPESVTSIESAFFNIKDLEIHGKSGSYAEQYANENNHRFVAK